MHVREYWYSHVPVAMVRLVEVLAVRADIRSQFAKQAISTTCARPFEQHGSIDQ